MLGSVVCNVSEVDGLMSLSSVLLGALSFKDPVRSGRRGNLGMEKYSAKCSLLFQENLDNGSVELCYHL